MSIIYSENLIPVMTSNSQDGFILSGSSFRSASEDYYKSFDNNDSTYWLTTNATRPSDGNYIKIKLPTAKKLGKISLKTPIVSTPYTSIKNFNIYGSNDDISYELISSKIELDNTNLQTHEFTCSKSYLYYRLNFLDSYCPYSDTFHVENYSAITELKLYAIVEYKIKYLICDKTNVLYTLDSSNNVIQSPSQILDEANYLTNGINDASKIPISQLKALGSLSDFKLLVYTDDTIKSEIKVIGDCNPIALNQWMLDNQCKILMWTDDTAKTEAKLVYGCDQFDMAQWLRDNQCKLLTWTDDLTKTSVNMVYNITNPYKIIDKIKAINNGKFNVLLKEF